MQLKGRKFSQSQVHAPVAIAVKSILFPSLMLICANCESQLHHRHTRSGLMLPLN